MQIAELFVALTTKDLASEDLKKLEGNIDKLASSFSEITQIFDNAILSLKAFYKSFNSLSLSIIQAIKTITKNFQNALQIALSGVKQFAKYFSLALAGITTSFLVLTFGIKKLTDGISKTAFEFRNLQIRGLNADYIYRLSKIAKGFGLSFEEIGNSAKTFASAMAQIKMPNGQVPFEAMARFGISIGDSFEKALEKIRKKISKKGTDLNLEFVFAQQLGISENLFRFLATAKKIDVKSVRGLTEKDIKEREKLAQAQAKMGIMLQELLVGFFRLLIPLVEKIATGINVIISFLQNTFKTFSPARAVKGLKAGVSGAYDYLSSFFVDNKKPITTQKQNVNNATINNNITITGTKNPMEIAREIEKINKKQYFETYNLFGRFAIEEK